MLGNTWCLNDIFSISSKELSEDWWWREWKTQNTFNYLLKHLNLNKGNLKAQILKKYIISLISSVQLLSHVWLFANPWTAVRQASLSIINSWSLPKLMSIEWWCHPAISSTVIPFSSCPHSLPGSGSFPMSQLFAWGGQSIGVSVSASVLPMNTQDWFPLGLTGWISLQCKGLSRVFSKSNRDQLLVVVFYFSSSDKLQEQSLLSVGELFSSSSQITSPLSVLLLSYHSFTNQK